MSISLSYHKILQGDIANHVDEPEQNLSDKNVTDTKDAAVSTENFNTAEIHLERSVGKSESPSIEDETDNELDQAKSIEIEQIQENRFQVEPVEDVTRKSENSDEQVECKRFLIEGPFFTIPLRRCQN